MQHGRRGDTGEARRGDTGGTTTLARRGEAPNGAVGGGGGSAGGKGERVHFSGRRKELCKGGAKPVAQANDDVQWSSMPNLQSLHHYNVIFTIGVVGVPFL
ncbi:hypothetical protein GUJ93_ZPchr0014g46520 [Zizania palustris]|uniref:Uncharacterized protein n=1 Tax=Zizania palustris TaxID=103762 RepID=A0A8J5SVV6_ZIZPA|nr:hypothetical protein GUJ93_ZPchr0014g46520 [Zizania palustris]